MDKEVNNKEPGTYPCLNCFYEPEWRSSQGVCKNGDPEDMYVIEKFVDPDEVRCNGAAIKYCPTWAPKFKYNSKEYFVVVQALYEQSFKITAKNPDDAVEKVGEGEGVEISTEFVKAFDTNTWRVEKIKK